MNLGQEPGTTWDTWDKAGTTTEPGTTPPLYVMRGLSKVVVPPPETPCPVPPLSHPASTGWRSAGEIGSWDQVEPEPYERTVEDPHQLEMAEAQRARRTRERRGGSILWTDHPLREPPTSGSPSSRFLNEMKVDGIATSAFRVRWRLNERSDCQALRLSVSASRMSGCRQRSSRDLLVSAQIRRTSAQPHFHRLGMQRRDPPTPSVMG
jgi:hypothetical protein